MLTPLEQELAAYQKAVALGRQEIERLKAERAELLDALQYFMGAVDDGDDPTEAYAKAERAIAKARG